MVVAETPRSAARPRIALLGFASTMARSSSSFRTDLGLPRGSFFRLRSPERNFSNHHRMVLSFTEPSPKTEMMFLLAMAALCPSLNSYKKSIRKSFKDMVLLTSVEKINNKSSTIKDDCRARHHREPETTQVNRPDTYFAVSYAAARSSSDLTQMGSLDHSFYQVDVMFQSFRLPIGTQLPVTL